MCNLGVKHPYPDVRAATESGMCKRNAHNYTGVFIFSKISVISNTRVDFHGRPYARSREEMISESVFPSYVERARTCSEVNAFYSLSRLFSTLTGVIVDGF